MENIAEHIGVSIIGQWIVIIIVLLLARYLTSNLKKVPSKKQTIAEMFVIFIRNFIDDNMGTDYRGFVPFIGTLGIYILFLNIIPLVGIEPPTKDISVTLALSLLVFLVIQGYAIKKVGVKHYFLGYFHPIAFMAPLNVLERLILPVSLALRLFGNIAAGALIMELVYEGLFHVSVFAGIALPIPLHFYFDVFEGVIQTMIFTMLTVVNIKIIAEH